MDYRSSLQERKDCNLNKIKTINPIKYSNIIQHGKRVREGERNTTDKNNLKEKSNTLSKTNSNIKELMDNLRSDRGDSSLNKISKKQKDETVKRNASYIVMPNEVNNAHNNDKNNNVKDKINSKLPKSIVHIKKKLPIRPIPKEHSKMDSQPEKPEGLTFEADLKNLRTIKNKDTTELLIDVAKRKPHERIINNKKYSNTEDIKHNIEPIDNTIRNVKPKSLIVNVPQSVADIKTNGTDSKKEYIDQINAPNDTGKIKNSNNKSSDTKTEKGSVYSNYYYQRKLKDKNENGDSKRDARTISLNDKNKASQKSIVLPGNLNKKTKIPKLIRTNSNKKDMDVCRNNKLGSKVSLEKRKRWQIKALSPKSPKRNMDSPPTEVAKWAPNSINKHTKLYYEAWVNTTLAAVSKGKYGKILLDKPNIQNFRKYLEERAKSPELMYEDYSDKRFIGTIKVNHKK